VGHGGKTINTLRLWSAATPHFFNFQEFSSGDFVGALAETLAAESLTRVLYPDDSTSMGQALRFVQEYFLVACSLADLVRRFRQSNSKWSSLPGKVAIQLNDTHPTLAVPELMRILLDEANLGWDEAWDITQKSLAYTNHTLLPEALEKWPVAWFELMLPRHLEIIYEINRRLLDDVRPASPGDEGQVSRVSLIEGRRAQVAWPTWPMGSHSTTVWLQFTRCCADDRGIQMFLNASATKPTCHTAPLVAVEPGTFGAIPRQSVTAGSPTLASWQIETAGWRQGLSQRFLQANAAKSVCRLTQRDRGPMWTGRVSSIPRSNPQ
jgi:hypothetical protein